MGLTKTTKQPSESYFIYGDFSSEMTTGETIDVYTITAVDNTGADATSIVLDISTLQPGIGDYTQRLICRIRAGTVLLSPYKFTAY